MNPFELRGPEFLFFYVVLSSVVMYVTWLLRRRLDGAANPALQSPAALVSDPYLIAHLRGGADETLRVALLSLVDRGLIVAASNAFETAENVRPEHGRRNIERELLRAFRTGGNAKTLRGLHHATNEYEETLRRLRLLPDEEIRYGRMLLYAIALAIIGGTAVVKLTIGLSRGRPVSFLIVFAFFALAILHRVVWARRTRHGDAFVWSVQRLFQGLRDRAATIQRGGGTADLALLAAAYGAMAVPRELFPLRDQLYPVPVNSSSSSSSSSSCGGSGCGGGGCGGGGCGGCGS